MTDSDAPHSTPMGDDQLPPSQHQGRRGQRQWQTRLQLIEGARAVFARVGVAEATIAQITTEANVGFGTFYLHFKTKDDALSAVLVEGFAPFNAEIDELQRQASTQARPWQETLKEIVLAYLHFAQENRDLMQIMFAEQVRVQQAEWQVFLRFAWRIVQLLKQVEPALSAPLWPGEPLPGTPTGGIIAYPFNLLTTMIVAMLNRAAIWWLRWPSAEGNEDAFTAETIATTVAQFMIAGLTSVLAPDQGRAGKVQENENTEHA